MPGYTLKLLVLSMAFSVAPASAGHCGGGRCTAAAAPKAHHSACPFERAREAAGAAAAAHTAAWTEAPTTITLIDRVPPDSPLGMGHGSGFLAP
jgi:hypothetical protein